MHFPTKHYDPFCLFVCLGSSIWVLNVNSLNFLASVAAVSPVANFLQEQLFYDYWDKLYALLMSAGLTSHGWCSLARVCATGMADVKLSEKPWSLYVTWTRRNRQQKWSNSGMSECCTVIPAQRTAKQPSSNHPPLHGCTVYTPVFCALPFAGVFSWLPSFSVGDLVLHWRSFLLSKDGLSCFFVCVHVCYYLCLLLASASSSRFVLDVTATNTTTTTTRWGVQLQPALIFCLLHCWDQ